eukprot:gene47-24_t
MSTGGLIPGGVPTMTTPQTVHVGGAGGVKRQKITIDEGTGETLEIVPLGSGSEVGRSCVVMKFKGKTIMFDCGVHPAHSGISQLPYFDHLKETGTQVDLCLITHFHLDHSGAVPYFVNKMDYKGRVFMTHPTKSICRMLWQDFAKINKIQDDQIYSLKDVDRTVQRIELLDFHQVIEAEGIRFTCYSAGHVLGACMFMVEIGGIRVLYTGDYSREVDRHLMPAEVPPMRIHVLIVESTYGTQNHMSRTDREQRLLGKIKDVVKNGGKVLLPTFALGRAQELVLMLEEYWNQNPELQSVPIYYNSPLATKCSRIFETYTALCSRNVQEQALRARNPWNLQHIRSMNSELNREKAMEEINSPDPCVVLAAPGMLQSGFSRELFEQWAPFKQNAVLLTGYAVEGTIAKKLDSQPESITMPDGQTIHVNCHVDFISFSAHSDYGQTSDFVREIRTEHVILVHGEENNMGKMRRKLMAEHGGALKVYTPQNCQMINMNFAPDMSVTVAGKLAEECDRVFSASASDPKRLKTEAVSDGSGTAGGGGAKEVLVNGILVEDAFGNRNLIHPQELSTFTRLEVCSFEQAQKLPFTHCSLVVLKRAIEGIYADVQPRSEAAIAAADESGSAQGAKLVVAGCVEVRRRQGVLELNWK